MLIHLSLSSAQSLYVSLLPFFFLLPSHRSVGTFARALDCSSSVRQPSLHMSAAAASRDITLVQHHLHSLARSLTHCTLHPASAVLHTLVWHMKGILMSICALPIVHAELLIMA